MAFLAASAGEDAWGNSGAKDDCMMMEETHHAQRQNKSTS